MLTQSFTVRYTDAGNGIAHLVTDEAVVAGRSRRLGRYQALCGQMFPVAPLVAPDGRPCARCQQLTRTAETRRQVSEPSHRHRHRRTGRVRRFRDLLFPSDPGGAAA